MNIYNLDSCTLKYLKSKIHKELTQLSSKAKIIRLKNGQRT